MSTLLKAAEFAFHHHKDQFRKGTKIPYVTHLFNCCKLLAERDCAEELLCAALLHDIVEDTPVTIEEVELQFGNRIAHLVSGATEPQKLRKENKDKHISWLERKKATLKFMEEQATEEQLLVIMADKLDNISSLSKDLKRIGEKVFERFNAPKEKQQRYYNSLVHAFKLRAANVSKTYLELFDEFENKVFQVFNQEEALLQL